MEEQWAWLTNYKCVYTGPSISLYREVNDQVCEPSWHNRIGNISFYMVIREMAAARNLVIVYLEIHVWRNRGGQMLNHNCIRELWPWSWWWNHGRLNKSEALSSQLVLGGWNESNCILFNVHIEFCSFLCSFSHHFSDKMSHEFTKVVS